jgi:hypothetical protein
MIRKQILHTSQKDAINKTLQEKFQSGVHFHATGTGKSWIALSLVLKFLEANGPKTNILWICEQKSILNEQFDTDTLYEKGFDCITNKFFLFDYSRNKPAKWSSYINSASVWGKPILIIINRAFLVSMLEYTNIRIPIHLIIHDECHSITNKTTQDFYQYMLALSPKPIVIGFTATPILTHEPFKRIISKYTIYNACRDGVILKPKIAWMKTKKQLTSEEIRSVCKELIQDLPYKKLLIWCGMIDLCNSTALEWQSDSFFKDYLIAVDTSVESSMFKSYEDFTKVHSNAILFCASKHREGSDIPNLDACIFLDQVSERNPKTFVQCVGRVLRKDKERKKKYGLIVDISAKSPIEICNRMNTYLQTEDAFTFPYKYSYTKIHNIQVNTLEVDCNPVIVEPTSFEVSIDIDLTKYFKREIPSGKSYSDRLQYEITLFKEKNLISYLFHALSILEMTQSVPHVTRGSCGSSLLCYLLGISNVDPVKYNIQFARFLNEHRNTLPDIDFDFPHSLRDEVFLQIYLKWPGRVARISNHIYYKEKSALRKALQKAGIRKRIPTLQLYDTIKKLSDVKRKYIKEESKRLEKTFRTYSLHCGGIVFYPTGIPKELILKSKSSSALSQITLNKVDISNNKQFKIDILSSRGLTQLYEALKFKQIDFDAHMEDEKTAELLASGRNIGITLAESPLIRKTLRELKPKSIHDIAVCLAIIRPAAKEARGPDALTSKDKIIFDDDAIDIIQKYLKCSAADADRIRRLVTKMDPKKLDSFVKENIPSCPKDLIEKFKDLRQYGFCKSHAYSYAQLVWQLAYMKAHHPQEFWKATLKNCHSSYRKWVHLYEAKLVGVIPDESEEKLSIFAIARRKKNKLMNPTERLKATGTWNDDPEDTTFFPGCGLSHVEDDKYHINGLIANSRVLSYTKLKKAVVFVGYGSGKYVEVMVTGKYLPIQQSIGVQCIARRVTMGVYDATDCVVKFW